MTRADAEDDAQGGEQGAGFLRAQVGDGLAEIGETEDHCAERLHGAACGAFMALGGRF